MPLSLPGPRWRKSSYSGHNGNCVEAAAGHGVVAIRDSKTPAASYLILPADHWRSLLTAVKRGAFDR
ncbi:MULTISPECIES: DUF397 domain-containing protein [Thermomonospora]|uniref:DUF397 domain-containing protein n=1 Tax=Thermomonospora curvata (strain ATCC 19995 / DSM 43183 / JCM 3096 / KCTC 9072 / NBRC 15933 / NCIMB 10081 / Henssen B9) TaxID=471852 RepID=D1A632_THECD|nr:MULTISPECIES: DUF397 domain-containing protein [Thermomonospora]ACZ00131.1 protein of unknown function DUF397 [Thermomonospora curvata DSM 43183]PKK11950.1 MAG: DUF397 domain-containing protein [Thermomonospora sp. CIF 1]